MDIFALHNLIYEIALLIGCVLAFGSMFGGHSHGGVHHDYGHGHGHAHAGHDHDSKDSQTNGFVLRFSAYGLSFKRFLVFLIGIEKLPIMLWLTIFFLFFGCIGMLINMVFGPQLGYTTVAGKDSALIALASALGVTSLIGHAFGRFLPTDETFAISQNEIVGSVGSLVLKATETSGLAQVHDFRGNLQQIQVRTTEGELPQGSGVIVTGFDEASGIYTVSAHQV